MGIWIGVLFCLLLMMFGVFAVSMVVVWKLMHPVRKPVTSSPSEEGLAYKSIGFQSRDGKTPLQGWFIPAVAAPKATLIFAHGYRGNRMEKNLPALRLTHSLVQRGCNVLLFDFRNCGESGGNLTTIGLDEKQDILGAIDWCSNHTQVPIGLIGFSMGAATSLLAAAESPKVSGVVADSSFSDLHHYLFENLSVWSKLPKYPFSPLMLLAIRYVMRKNPRLVQPKQSLERIYPRPVLFIHGDEDQAIPYRNSEKMAASHPDAFSFWKVSGVGHIGAYSQYPDEYADRVIRFFNGVLARRQTG